MHGCFIRCFFHLCYPLFYSLKEGICRIAAQLSFLTYEMSPVFLKCWVSKIHHGNRPCCCATFHAVKRRMVVVADIIDWQVLAFRGSSFVQTISSLCFLMEFNQYEDHGCFTINHPTDRNWWTALVNQSSGLSVTPQSAVTNCIVFVFFMFIIFEWMDNGYECSRWTC